MSGKSALITGIFGQDAAYLAQYLLEAGYRVYGTHRRGSSRGSWRLAELGIESEIEFVELELLEHGNIFRVLQSVKPDEIYNLAAQSFVGVSFTQPLYTTEVDGLAVTRLLEAVREINPQVKFYQASTSEMFGNAPTSPQNEDTAFVPRSPYGIAKLYAHLMVRHYREAYGIHAVSGILFNHESPLRGLEFVTRKITSTLALIRERRTDQLMLGNLAARRDWGHARDFVKAMHMMVGHEKPTDFVIATGVNHSVEDFVSLAGEIAGFALEWDGDGIERNARDRKTGKTVVTVNPAQFRPADVDHLVGDASRAQAELGWQPGMNFEGLVAEMMEVDLRRARNGSALS